MIAISPIAGVLLDRHGRTRLVVLDYAIGAFSLFLIASLASLDALPVALLLAIVTFGLVLANEPVLAARFLKRPLPIEALRAWEERKETLHEFTKKTTFLVRTFFFVFLGMVVSWRGLTPAYGDLNCDAVVNFDDINPFVLLLSDPAGWQTAYPNCNMLNGDTNGDGVVNFDDINPFVLALSNPAGYIAQYPNCFLSNADMNGDGHVDFSDINPFVTLLSGR